MFFCGHWRNRDYFVELIVPPTATWGWSHNQKLDLYVNSLVAKHNFYRKLTWENNPLSLSSLNLNQNTPNSVTILVKQTLHNGITTETEVENFTQNESCINFIRSMLLCLKKWEHGGKKEILINSNNKNRDTLWHRCLHSLLFLFFGYPPNQVVPKSSLNRLKAVT